MKPFLLATLLFLSHLSYAQSFARRETEKNKATNPISDYYQQQLSESIKKQLDKIDWTRAHKTTGGGDTLYTIPVVVHVLHNYGTELLSDSAVNEGIAQLNSYFLLTNPDSAQIIDKFKPIAASTQIAFKLATIDPNGNPTRGIEHIYTYLTYGYLDQAKINQWPQDQYLNIWTVVSLETGPSSPAGSAYRPSMAETFPYYDGMSIAASYFPQYGQATSFFMARSLNLPNSCSLYAPCTDYDQIPDTPPCIEEATCSNLYDTTCDTPNIQNIMAESVGWTTCENMFTYGQGQYMQAVLQQDIGKRDSLVTASNTLRTGINLPAPDMLPIADFSSNRPFVCLGVPLTFTDHSWNDTIISRQWTFSNSASTHSSTSKTVVNNFAQTGWVTVSLSATGNNTGTNNIALQNRVYIADTTPTNAMGYYQEFNPGGDLDKWPLFNYYGNNFQWQLCNTGFYDNTGIEYLGYDSRPFPQNTTGGPIGDIDDIYTPVFDLTGLGGSNTCYLNFMSSGAYTSSAISDAHDVLEIDYSVNGGIGWTELAVLNEAEIANKGSVADPYTPSSMTDWIPQSILLPTAARTRKTIFRFRYEPSGDATSGYSTGNNFYMDRISFNIWPENVPGVENAVTGMSVCPSPTHTGAFVNIINPNGGEVRIDVSDIAGKTVYETKQNTLSGSIKIYIPQDVLSQAGVYIVHAITDEESFVAKLISY